MPSRPHDPPATETLREPIVSLLGHVDHGKTTLLDRIAGSVRAAKEVGGITQHIGAIEVPGPVLRRLAEGTVRLDQLQVPGLLFVDTPGHKSFETMRRRGGALADLAILVIDARESVMPQTRESIQILRKEKTPFAIALTKIDLLPGWRKVAGPARLADQIARSAADFGKSLDAHLYAVAEEMDRLGFSCERYDRVSDFTRNVGIVPVSSKSGVGVPELIALLVGLAQRFLKDDLKRVNDGGEATILERSDQKGVGPVGNVIVYRGSLKVGDEIVVNGRTEPFRTRVRGIYRPAPIRADRPSKQIRLDSLSEVRAAAGVFLSAPGIEEAMPGGLLKVVRDPAAAAEAMAELARESTPVAELAESGVAIYADTLGGLEALAFECREKSIPVHEAGVGPVGRPTVMRAATVHDPTHRAVIAFAVPVLPDALPEGEVDVKVCRADVMYRAIEEYLAWRTERQRQLDAARRQAVPHPALIEVMSGYVFRASKPAIVGVRVLGGTLRPGVRLMHPDGSEVGLLRSLQKESESIPSAEETAEVAASIDGAVVGRNVKEGDRLLVDLPESAARQLKGQTLTPHEQELLEQVLKMRRASQPFWGQ
ncbi:MAG TPA: translation initiation factor IF-2 [Thermoplasmata archaeon]|nr:translation initiation factor IF-2 [Thermoplasmata archaeon]